MRRLSSVICLVAAVLELHAVQDARSGVEFTLEPNMRTVDPARSVFVTVKAVAPKGVDVTMPDIGERLRGFSAAEEFAEDPFEEKGRTVHVVNWRLVPEPCADEYKIKPLLVGVTKGTEDLSFTAGPLYFGDPAARTSVEGGIEVDPKKDFPPLSWKLVGAAALVLAGIVIVAAAVFFLLRYLARRVKEHFMSPIERAWAELGRLMSRGLPERGKFKDFYIELTMVVRRYIQRKYGIRAPHLTTEEFLRELGSTRTTDRARLAAFLESADMVKFAGVEASVEMAADATKSAKEYLTSDSSAGSSAASAKTSGGGAE